jgi:thiamine phosphate synthase YjbQ (UPF0047 family)
MIENLFPAKIWKTSLIVDQSIKNDILGQIEKNFVENKDYLHPYWGCKIHTSLLENNNINFSSIIPFFKIEYEKFSEQLKLNFHNYEIHDIWYNYYLNGYNQEFHDHISSDRTIYSIVYFLRLDNDHPKITFHNYTNYHAYYSSNKKIKNIYNRDDINHSIVHICHNLNVKENDLIIFPSHIPHGVFIQKTDNPRITISANLKIL